MQEYLSKIWESLLKVRILTKKLQKYSFNTFYKKQYDDEILLINRNYKFFTSSIQNPSESLKEKLSEMDKSIQILLGNKQHKTKLKSIKTLERFWPELEIEFSDTPAEELSFEIPKEIPDNEQRKDLNEAIKDFTNECYLSSSVACRRAFEGALVEAYRSIVKSEPEEDVKCPHCKNTIRRSYIGIVKLHNWAVTNSIIPDKLKPFGFLISNLGAGGAHPPLTDFPRDPEIAKLSIQTTLALVKQIFLKLDTSKK